VLDGVIDPARPVELDVGCGKGRFLLARARAFPATQFIGLERESARLARIDLTARREGLENVHLLRADAIAALTLHLPANLADAIYFFFPDPWPKRRHHRRRLFTPLFLDAVRRVLKPGGCFHLATDQADYFEMMQESLSGDYRFEAIETFQRQSHEQTDFEVIFRGKNQTIGEASYRLLAVDSPK